MKPESATQDFISIKQEFNLQINATCIEGRQHKSVSLTLMQVSVFQLNNFKSSTRYDNPRKETWK